jgi:biopolymer transport protein ExbB
MGAYGMKTVFEVFNKGGVTMYFIMLCSIVMLAVVLEKFYNLRSVHTNADEIISTVANLIKKGEIKGALAFLKQTPGVLPRILETGIHRYEYSREGIENAINNSIQKQIPVLDKYLGVLGTVAAIAPLFGLLGTITGMINSFSKIATEGTTGPAVIATGVYEALYTTAAGLIVAIPAVIFYNYFKQRIQNTENDLEIYGNKMTEIIMLAREGKDYPEDLVA